MIRTVAPLTFWNRNRRPGGLASAMSMALALSAGGGCSESGPRGPVTPRASSVPGVASQAGGIERDAAGPVPALAPRVSPPPDVASGAGSEDALFTALERMERRVAGAMARVRESVVALEYTAADSPSGARRVATGVVISPQGEVLSIRIDRPPLPIPSGATSSSGSTSTPAPGAAASPAAEPLTAGVKGGRSPRPRQARGGNAPIIARDAAGRRHVAAWVAADPETGLTLLRIAPKAVRPIRIATDPPKLGSSVFVVGNPFGLGHSVSRGHVAGLDRALELGPRQLGGLTQVQVPLYPGDSGATVANLRGEWLGLIRGGLAAANPAPTPPHGPRGREDDPERDAEMDHDHDIGFAIPSRDAIWIADQLRSAGRVDRAYLGVRLETADATDAEGAGLSEVIADTPASGAGLRVGDRIVALDDHPIRTPADLTDRLDRTRAHTEIKLGVIRRLPEAGDDQIAPAPSGPATPRLDRIVVSLRAASRPNGASVDVGAVNPEMSSAEIPGTRGGVDPVSVVRTATVNPAAPGHAVISRTSTSTSSLEVGGADRGSDPAPTSVPLRPATVATAAIPPASKPPAPIPAQRPLPLESQALPPRPVEIEPISPRAVIERLERIERRLDRVERRETAAPAPSTGTGKPRE